MLVWGLCESGNLTCLTPHCTPGLSWFVLGASEIFVKQMNKCSYLWDELLSQWDYCLLECFPRPSWGPQEWESSIKYLRDCSLGDTAFVLFDDKGAGRLRAKLEFLPKATKSRNCDIEIYIWNSLNREKGLLSINSSHVRKTLGKGTSQTNGH